MTKSSQSAQPDMRENTTLKRYLNWASAVFVLLGAALFVDYLLIKYDIVSVPWPVSSHGMYPYRTIPLVLLAMTFSNIGVGCFNPAQGRRKTGFGWFVFAAVCFIQFYDGITNTVPLPW